MATCRKSVVFAGTVLSPPNVRFVDMGLMRPKERPMATANGKKNGHVAKKAAAPRKGPDPKKELQDMKEKVLNAFLIDLHETVNDGFSIDSLRDLMTKMQEEKAKSKRAIASLPVDEYTFPLNTAEKAVLLEKVADSCLGDDLIEKITKILNSPPKKKVAPKTAPATKLASAA
jgi:hypothetical protein